MISNTITAEEPAMIAIEDWSDEAYNPVPDSANQIHSDAMAEAYGFHGALVPGVTISGYLLHPAIAAWGLNWLTRGWAHVTVRSPLYDRSRFEVRTESTARGYEASLRSDDRLCAVAEVELPEQAAEPPTPQGHPLMDRDHVPPRATPENMRALRDTGCLAARFRWSADQPMASYLRDASRMPSLLRTDEGTNAEGYANPSFLLGCANYHFAAIAHMNPWIHMETRSRNFAPVPLDTELLSELTIVDLFERKGHQFADCRVNLFRRDDSTCVCSIEQRAIYQVRPPQSKAAHTR